MKTTSSNDVNLVAEPIEVDETKLTVLKFAIIALLVVSLLFVYKTTTSLSKALGEKEFTAQQIKDRLETSKEAEEEESKAEATSVASDDINSWIESVETSATTLMDIESYVAGVPVDGFYRTEIADDGTVSTVNDLTEQAREYFDCETNMIWCATITDYDWSYTITNIDASTGYIYCSFVATSTDDRFKNAILCIVDVQYNSLAKIVSCSINKTATGSMLAQYDDFAADYKAGTVDEYIDTLVQAQSSQEDETETYDDYANDILERAGVSNE